MELKITAYNGLLKAFLNRLNRDGKLIKEEKGNQLKYGKFLPTRVRVYKLNNHYYALLYKDNLNGYWSLSKIYKN